jgi:hypothetical protein
MFIRGAANQSLDFLRDRGQNVLLPEIAKYSFASNENGTLVSKPVNEVAGVVVH